MKETSPLNRLADADRQNDLPRLRAAGEIHRKIMQKVAKILTTDYAGMTTTDLDAFIDDQISKSDMVPAFKSVPGYKWASCISPQGVVVHGVPNDTALRAGDYITVDFGVGNKGYIVDAAETWIVGQENSEKEDELILAAKEIRDAMINKAIAGTKVLDLPFAAQDIATKIAQRGIYILPEYTGHGVGKNNLHIIPVIPCVPVNMKMPTYDYEHQALRERYRLREGDVICVEPILVRTKKNKKKGLKTTVQPDGWTVRLDDPKAIAAHVESCLLITKGDPEILA